MNRPDLDSYEQDAQALKMKYGKGIIGDATNRLLNVIAYVRELETWLQKLSKECEEGTTTIVILGELVSQERNKKIEALKRIKGLEAAHVSSTWTCPECGSDNLRNHVFEWGPSCRPWLDGNGLVECRNSETPDE